jgi:hypothetical protein
MFSKGFPAVKAQYDALLFEVCKVKTVQNDLAFELAWRGR